MKSIFIAVLILSASLALPFSAAAHGLVTTQQQTSGAYTMEFEYDVLSQIEAGQYTTYDFILLDTKSQQPINYDRVFVRYNEPDKSALLTTSLFPIVGFGPTAARLAFAIPNAGSYSISTEFYKDDKQIAAGGFNFTVVPNSQAAQAKTKEPVKPTVRDYVMAVLGFVVGGGLIWFLKPKRK